MLRLNVFVTGAACCVWYDGLMRHEFLYGNHSCEKNLTAQNIATLYQLGHNAHLRILGESLKHYALHRELQILHYLKHYKMYTVVDISKSNDAYHILQHVRELADCLILQDGAHDFVIEHDDPTEDDSARAKRILSSLRSIEASQEQGKDIRGYFCGLFTPEITQSDLVLRAIIQQARA